MKPKRRKQHEKRLSYLLSLTLLFCLVSLPICAHATIIPYALNVEICECENPMPYEAGFHEGCNATSETVHQWSRVTTYLCGNCGGVEDVSTIYLYPIYLEQSGQGTRTLKHSSTHHWYETPIYWDCPACYEGGVTYQKETEYAHASSQWDDGGHTGGSHKFYLYCDTCGYQMDSLTVPCPGGDNHASIYQIPNVPIEVETE